MARSRGTTPTPRPCPGCGTPLLTQWVGRVAALKITAATTPITPRQEAELRTPNRLTWCLVTGPHRAPQLRSRCLSRACTHDVVIEHHCTPEPTTLF